MCVWVVSFSKWCSQWCAANVSLYKYKLWLQQSIYKLRTHRFYYSEGICSYSFIQKYFFFPHDLWHLMATFVSIQANNVENVWKTITIEFVLNYYRCMRQCMWFFWFWFLTLNTVTFKRYLQGCICYRFKRPMNYIFWFFHCCLHIFCSRILVFSDTWDALNFWTLFQNLNMLQIQTK